MDPIYFGFSNNLSSALLSHLNLYAINKDAPREYNETMVDNKFIVIFQTN